MARPVTTLMVFFVCFNLFAGALMSTGVAGMLGLDANVGGDDEVDQTIGNAEEVTTGSGLGETLFGMYNTLASGLTTVTQVIFPGLNMLSRAGVPAWLTNGLLAPVFTIVIFIGFVSFIRGWGL